MGQDPTAGDSPAPHERTGRVGKYQIVRALGRGAMGVVYLAQDTARP